MGRINGSACQIASRLGRGHAGFLAAITVKFRLPDLPVTVLRSKDIGIIGVGEGTTLTLPQHLHDYMKLDIKDFYRVADPQWKLGIRFLWGKPPLLRLCLFTPARHQIQPPVPNDRLLLQRRLDLRRHPQRLNVAQPNHGPRPAGKADRDQ